MESKEEQVIDSRVTPSKYSKRVVLSSILDRSDKGLELIGERVVVGGWVKSFEQQRKEVPPSSDTAASGAQDIRCVEILQSRVPIFRSLMKILVGNNCPFREKLDAVVSKPAPPSVAYLLVNDGSCIESLQVVLDSSTAPLDQLSVVGTSILAEGVLRHPLVPGKQATELKVEKIIHVGTVNPAKYPLSKKRLPMEVLRNYSHLRPRTTTVASIVRIRSELTHATHTFFQKHGFLYVHLPIISTTVLNGSITKFHATTLLRRGDKEESNTMDDTKHIKLEAVKAAIKEKSNTVEELGRTDSNKEALITALQDLQKTNELALQLEAKERMIPGTSLNSGPVDFSTDYFSCETYLTTSGQLHLESYACSLGNVYSFGPRFRAEKSQLTKCLAETWVVEFEIAFADLEDAINCAEDYLKFLFQWILENCFDDIKFISKRVDKSVIDLIQSLASNSFEKISYTDAIDLLKKVTNKAFEEKLEWGVSLAEEHERYLADEVYNRPIVIYNYPKEIKPFYMRLNDDAKTVAAVDIILPKCGTFIRGGQREERIDILHTRIKESGLSREQYEWYLDLRRHGTVKHSGFSIGFEQMVLFATGLSDIRDVIPFPRSYGRISN